MAVDNRHEQEQRLANLSIEHEQRLGFIARRHMFRRLILVAVLLGAMLAPLAAQNVTVANYSGSEFAGWKRCTVDVMPPHEAGQVGDVRYVLGRRIGIDVRVIDLQMHIAPGEVRTIDLSTATPWTFVRPPLPASPLTFFGVPSIANVPLQLVDVQPDGAAWLAHLRARTGRMLCTDLWVPWYPNQPGWCTGEVVVTASNPLVADMTATVPPEFRLRYGSADVIVPGLAPSTPNQQGAQAGGACLLPEGTVIGDGQARSFPLTLVWRQHMTNPVAWSSAGAAASMSICANGIAKLWPGGNPRPPAGTSQLAWTIGNWAGAIERLHSWEAGPIGVVAGSGQTGAQDDQVFVGWECSGTQGLGAETVRYLVALGQSRRPCQHLEANGDLLVLSRHPQCVFWSARPHFSSAVSPDQLGKARAISELDTHGWFGPDRQHWLENTVAVAARLTGSPALQWQLAAQARAFLLGETTDPAWATSYTDSSREIGWAGILVAHLWTGLEDRALAERVAERWRQRVLQVYIPQLGSKPGDIWHPLPDPRILDVLTGYTMGWMPEHQAVGAYGLDLACSLVGPVEGRAMALRAAKAVMQRAYTQNGVRWVEWERLGYRGADLLPASEYVEHRGAHRTGWYAVAWFSLGVATVLRHEPTNASALAIWSQMLTDSGGGGNWIAPEVR